MKTLRFAFSMVLVVLLTLPVLIWAQNKEIPLTTSSKEALDYFLKGRDKLENFENTVVANLFEQAILADPDFAMAYLYRTFAGANHKERMTNLEQAIARVNTISEAEKNLILSVQAAFSGDNRKQKEYLDKLLIDYPLDKRVHQDAGLFYFSTQDFENALKQFTIAVELDAKFAPAFNMIGYAQSKLMNYDEAGKAFQSYIQLTPESPNGYDSYAELLLQKGDYDNSIAQYKKALEYNPYFYFSLVGLGHNYTFKGDYDTARKYYQQYYDHAPTPNDRYAALNWEALSYIYEGRYEDAMATFDRYRDLAEKEKDNGYAVLGLASQGHLLIETGKAAEGKKCYDKAAELINLLEFDEASRNFFNTYSAIWHLYAVSANGEFEHARQDEVECTQKVANRKNKKEMMFLNSVCGLQAFNEGNYNHAIEHFSKADPEDPLKVYYHAMTLEKIGDTQNASELLEKISKCNDNSLSLALVRSKAIKQLQKPVSQ